MCRLDGVMGEVGYYSDVSCGHDRMMVYNYRVQENGPRWSDSLTNKSNGYHWYQMTDSVFWRWEGDNIFLWKVGEKAHEMRLAWKNDGCSESFKIDRIRHWLDGKFIALGGKLDADGENCQYAVLDTAAKIIVYKRLDKNLEWIKKCDDVRAWGEDVYCLYYDASSANIYLKNENKMKDSILIENQKWISGAFFLGKMILADGNLCEYKDAWVCYPRQGVLKMGFHANNGIILQF